MFNLFKKRKSLSELETERDVLLFTLDNLLAYNLINIDEYNRILVNGLPYFKGE
jgi:hypothetical protein